MSQLLATPIRCRRTLPGDYPLPAHAKPGDAGLDLAMRRWTRGAGLGWLALRTRIVPGGRLIIDTGIALELPPGWVGLVQPRSGLARDQGIVAVTGVVDSSYRGSIGVTLENRGFSDVPLNIGDRIAQLVVVPHLTCRLELAEALSESERGADGFGSTGLSCIEGGLRGGDAA